MTKEQMIAVLDKEIEFAKGCGMPQFVSGLLQAKSILTLKWGLVREKEKSHSDGLDYKRDHERGD